MPPGDGFDHGVGRKTFDVTGILGQSAAAVLDVTRTLCWGLRLRVGAPAREKVAKLSMVRVVGPGLKISKSLSSAVCIRPPCGRWQRSRTRPGS